jgi:hypothetical protein
VDGAVGRGGRAKACPALLRGESERNRLRAPYMLPWPTPSTIAARFTSRGLTQRIAPNRPAPAMVALAAVTLIFGSPSFARCSTSALVRSSPSMTNAFFGPVIFHFAVVVAVLNAVGSEGTKSS